MPHLVVVAGPNGSGKSTLTADLGVAALGPILDPDAVARRLAPDDPKRAAVAAGREVLKTIERNLAAGVSFTLESTLSGKGLLDTMRKARDLGYRVQLVYVCLETPERNILRVQDRVAAGGHNVPDDDVRRRYSRSLENLPVAIRIAHKAAIFDNSLTRRRRVLEFENGRMVWSAPALPDWARGVAQALSPPE